MKKNSTKLIIAAFILSSIMFSCGKEDNVAPNSVCQVIQIGPGTELEKSTYEYNNSKQLIKSTSFDTASTKISHRTYTYSANSVEEKYYNSKEENTITSTYTIGTNGFASLKVEIPTTSHYIDSVFYTYNKDGYLIKEENKYYIKNDTEFSLAYRNTTTNTISNGNTVKEVRSYNGQSSISTNEFSNRTNSSNVFNTLSLTGKPNKNMISKSNGDSYIYTYTFEYNASNAPVKAIINKVHEGKSSTEEVSLHYSCK